MANFLRRTLLALIGLGVIGILLSVAFELVMRQQDPAFRLYQAISDARVQPRILILGDSRAALDIDAGQLSDEVFNWAEVGEGLRQTLLKAEYALRTKPSVEYLVLPIDTYVLGEYRAANHGYAQQMGYASRDLLRRHFSTSDARILRNLLAYAAPMLDHESRLKFRSEALGAMETVLGKPPEPPFTQLDSCLGLHFTNEVDWAGQSEEKRNERLSRRVKGQYNDPLVVPDMLAVLDAIFDKAAARGVKVIGLRHPISNEYLTALKARDLSEVERALAARPFHARLDYEGMFADTPAAFNDMDHLRHAAAQVMTRRLTADLAAISGRPVSSQSLCAAKRARGILVPAIGYLFGDHYRIGS